MRVFPPRVIIRAGEPASKAITRGGGGGGLDIFLRVLPFVGDGLWRNSSLLEH